MLRCQRNSPWQYGIDGLSLYEASMVEALTLPIRLQRGPSLGGQSWVPLSLRQQLGTCFPMAAASRSRGKRNAALRRRAAFLPRRPAGGRRVIWSAYRFRWPDLCGDACATRGRAPDLGFVCAQYGSVARCDGAPAKDRVVDSRELRALLVLVPITNDLACARRGSWALLFCSRPSSLSSRLPHSSGWFRSSSQTQHKQAFPL